MSCIVADAGPLIALAKLHLLNLPACLYGEAIVPETVFGECQVQARRTDAELIAGAVEGGILTLRSDRPWPNDHVQPSIDKGELAALALAQHLHAPLLIDDRRGRRAAHGLGVAVTGVCGVLLVAKREGIVGELAPLLKALERRGYYIADTLRASVLNAAGESPPIEAKTRRRDRSQREAERHE
ncbi:MAG: DUF3368 domain-containing protein [Gammaproteobacteria bacterium]|nr:DUF3368 domain-containing protein [Gammaproteobacteria bacterium]MBU1962873.1 DUF3368 domain-containing protein [Gammaproteobacteria bacterium]